MSQLAFRIQFNVARYYFLGLAVASLLQRSQVARILPRLESLARAPLAKVLQFASAVAGFVGAPHALTGATTFTANPPSPAHAEVGVTFSLAFTITGTPEPVMSWLIQGPLPPGLSIPGLSGSTLNSGLATITGVPTLAGSYQITAQPFKGLNNTDVTNGVAYPIAIVVVDNRPPIDSTFLPNPSANETAIAGEPFSLTFAVSGMQALSWRVTGEIPPGLQLVGAGSQPLNGNVLNGATGALSGAPTTAGVYTFSVQAYEAANLGGRADPEAYSVTIAVELAQTPLEAWKEQFLGDEAAPDDGDPDRDGLPNLLEYVLDTHPTRANGAAQLMPRVVATPQGLRLRLALPLEAGPSDVTIQVQAAETPNGPWQPIATSANGSAFSGAATIVADAPGLVEIQDSGAIAADQPRFMRIRVSR